MKKEQIKEWTEELYPKDKESLICFWLDCAYHNNKLPAKINYSDIELISEVLEGNIKHFISSLLDKVYNEGKQAGYKAGECI
jgi:hypothetical protein